MPNVLGVYGAGEVGIAVVRRVLFRVRPAGLLTDLQEVVSEIVKQLIMQIFI